MSRIITLASLIICLSVSILVFAQSNNAYLIVDIAPGEVNSLGAVWGVKEISDSVWWGSGYMLALSASIYGTNYTVTFKSDIYGWKAPEDVEVTVQPGKVTKVVGIYEQEKGALKVNIYPTTAVDAGAKWRRVGQEIWRNSGEIEKEIPFGIYKIEFYKLENWDTPPEVEVQIKDKTVVEVNATYTQHLGSLQVNISPESAVTEGASWKIQGKTDWLSSGFKYEMLAVGTYVVEFKEIPNWQAPSPIEVTIEKDQLEVLNVEYISLLPEGATEGGEGSTEGEGEGEGGIFTECGCRNTDQGKVLRNFLIDILFVGLVLSITASNKLNRNT